MPDFLHFLVLLLFILAAAYAVTRAVAFFKISAFTGKYPGLKKDIRMPGTLLYASRLVLYVIISLLLLLVLYLPLPGDENEQTKTSARGVDILFVVDVSLSMNAVDVSPNRLTVFKQSILSALPQLQGNRFGIVAFAGTAFVYCPMTNDLSAFTDYVRSMDVDMIVDSGTNIAEGVELAGKILQSGKLYRNHLVVLVSDGENMTGDMPTQIQSDFIVAAAGTEAGGAIYYSSENGTGYITKDRRIVQEKNPNLVISKRNSDVLKEIADSQNGSYVEVYHLAEEIISKVSRMEKNKIDILGKANQNLNHNLLFAAIFLMLLDWFVIEYLIYRELIA